MPITFPYDNIRYKNDDIKCTYHPLKCPMAWMEVGSWAHLDAVDSFLHDVSSRAGYSRFWLFITVAIISVLLAQLTQIKAYSVLY